MPPPQRPAGKVSARPHELVERTLTKALEGPRKTSFAACGVEQIEPGILG